MPIVRVSKRILLLFFTTPLGIKFVATPRSMSCSPSFSQINLRSHGDVRRFVVVGDEPDGDDVVDEEDVSESLPHELLSGDVSCAFSSFVL